ncbi:MAG TPA: type III pantothenate kinase [Oculatellaceae cyanobacterium]
MTNRIAIDIGNSRISCGLFINHELKELKHHPSANGDAASKSIVEMASAAKTDRVAVCSVVPSVSQPMIEHLTERELRTYQVSAANQRIISDTYTTMGADRVANAVGALRIYAKSEIALVIDLGTATTLTAVSPDGKFLGGMIALGLGQTFAALHKATEQLPELKMGANSGLPEPLANDTQSAITAGCVLGHLGMIEYWIEAVKRKLNRECTVIATGGYANLIGPRTKSVDHVDAYLTIHGINFIAEAAEDPGDLG